MKETVNTTLYLSAERSVEDQPVNPRLSKRKQWNRLLRRLRSGAPLTLAEYGRVDDMLKPFPVWHPEGRRCCSLGSDRLRQTI
jgi:hypothetical protein